MKNKIEIENLERKEKIENRYKKKLRINKRILNNGIHKVKVYKEIKNKDSIVRVVDIKDIGNIKGFEMWLETKCDGSRSDKRDFKFERYDWVYGELKLVTYRELDDEEKKEIENQRVLKSRYNHRVPNKIRGGFDLDWVKKELLKNKKEVEDNVSEYHKNWWIYK